MPSWVSCADEVSSPSSSGLHAATQAVPSITVTTVSQSKDTATTPVESDADHRTTSTTASQRLQCKPSQTRSQQASQVWKHFDKVDGATARCTFCNKIFKHGGNTSNLIQHLNRKHILLCSTIEGNRRRKSGIPDSGSDADDPPPSKQMKFPAKDTQLQLTKINEAFEKISSFGDGGKTADKITNSILYMIAVDEMPLSTVENVGFRRFVKTVAPLYQVPSRRSITKLLDSKYEKLKERFKDTVQNIPGGNNFYAEVRENKKM